MEVTFSSFEDLKQFFINCNYFVDQNNYHDATFIDNSDGEIERRINEYFILMYGEDEEEYNTANEEEKKEIEQEKCTTILEVSKYVDSPALVNFIMDKNPDIRHPIDLQGNSSFCCVESEYFENNKILLERGFSELINEEIYVTYGIFEERRIYPIHLIAGVTICSKTKLDTIKLMKQYGVNLNSTTSEKNKTALIIFIKELLEYQKITSITNVEIDIIKQLATRTNLDICDSDGNKPKLLIRQLNIPEKHKELIINM